MKGQQKKMVDCSLKKILILSDGKKGHVNQSIALAKAICHQTPTEFEIYEVTGKSFFKSLFDLIKYVKVISPIYVIAAGRRTNLPLIICGLMRSVITIVLMRPQYPTRFFDWCVIPEHDGIKNKANVICTVGSLNDIHCSKSKVGDYDLILLGGYSNEFRWNNESIIDQVEEIRERLSSRIILTGSRRTPPTFFEKLKNTSLSSIECYTADECGADCYLESLLGARRVWVTMDSVNMVYEALSAGKPVGILELPVVKKGRVLRGIKDLMDKNWLTPLSKVKSPHELTDIEIPTLNEAQRVAGIIFNG